MMMFLSLVLGLLPPTILGWALLRVLEGKNPVLLQMERWLCGFALGVTMTMFIEFSLNAWLGVPLNWWTILLMECVPAAALCVLALRLPGTTTHLPAHGKPARWITVCLGLLLAFTLLKIAGGIAITLTTPSYYSDTFSNWNYRAKVYADQQTVPAALPPDTTPSPLSSYPPTVPLLKANLALLNGAWNEGLVNIPHELWFLAAGCILWYLIRRRSSAAWATLGAIAYWSLPLALLQGTNAYADVFFSLHYLCLVHFLLMALTADTEHDMQTGLRLSILPIALLPFTKNEGLALFMPIAALLVYGVILNLRQRGMVKLSQLWTPALWLAGLMGALLLSWIGYKMHFGLTFGNAKAIGDLGIGWQPGVLSSVFYNTFLEGNWLLLFPYLLILLAHNFRSLRSDTVLLFLLCAVALPYGIQLLIFLFTGLSSEAIMQTGYARGIIQIVPVIVALTVLLLKKSLLTLRHHHAE